MDNTTGIVMEIKKNIAYLMTSTGEFTKVKVDKSKPVPSIGSQYSGLPVQNVFMNNNLLRYTSAACLALVIFLSGGTAYTYYKPVSTVTVSINPSMELKSNLWNRVIYVSPLNEDGNKLLKEISVKNKAVDDALTNILEQAKKDNFINDNYKKDNKVITINISGKDMKLSSFQKEVKRDNLNTSIDINGTNIFNNSSNKTNDNPSSTDNKDTKPGKDSLNNNMINNNGDKSGSNGSADLGENNAAGKSKGNNSNNNGNKKNNSTNPSSKNLKDDSYYKDNSKNKNNYNKASDDDKYEDSHKKEKNNQSESKHYEDDKKVKKSDNDKKEY
ncbi:anti-sigma factor domain-containing protein [Clostridium sp. A1-XYC3]|uniref:Anti-sigma factor domain-containing protein n=1 Tax=Clostridium tanneri TaxID=3037988 RepID=A0ABU4JVV9_9CLOT|nr:anti-sigma factor domain-containing protein [Clostridium sp. A1-XYC3]MDW8802305.1 anti-sigma factor domain-containing protein [Clostridium sp. A1-XYC3]